MRKIYIYIQIQRSWYNIQNMSQIIDLFEQSQPPTSEELKQILKSVFRTNLFVCKSVVDDGKSVTFVLKASETTFRFSTIWCFHLNRINFVLEISFYNWAEDDLLRAYNDRMKFQLVLMLRYFNLQIVPDLYFMIDADTRALRLIQILPSFFKTAAKQQDIQNLAFKIIKIMQRFDELFNFLQPQFEFAKQKQNQKLEDAITKLNKLKAVMLQTTNRRYNIQAYLYDLIKMKNISPREYNTMLFMQQMQLTQIYMTNVVEFQKSQLGLEDVDGFEKFQNIRGAFQKQLDDKRRNENPKDPVGKNKAQKDKDPDKILYGLLNIAPAKIKQNEQQKSDSESQVKIPQIGAHSQIQNKKFEYEVAETINAGTVNMNMREYRMMGKKKKGELTYKVCNIQAESSRNSFMNQIAFLKYARDMFSPFIARYYLLIKETWDEKDVIYMNTYQQNVFDLINKRKTLSLRARLELSYRIAKGLCFLYSKQVLHRDFKPPNVVVDSCLIPKIIDFGSCTSHYKEDPGLRKFKPHQQRLLTTPGFHKSYNKLSQEARPIAMKFSRKSYEEHPLFDVYGFGKTLCYIFFHSFQLPEPTSARNKPHYNVYSNLIFLLDKCLQPDPDDRPCFGEITTFLGVLNQLISNAVTCKSDNSDGENTNQNKNRV